jgi:hypothetical protein
MQSLVGTSILRLNTMSVLGSFADMPRLGRFFHKTLLLAALPVGVFAFAGTGRADVIADVNAQLLNIIQYTSPALIDGPPNVAREIAMVNGAMYDGERRVRRHRIDRVVLLSGGAGFERLGGHGRFGGGVFGDEQPVWHFVHL